MAWPFARGSRDDRPASDRHAGRARRTLPARSPTPNASRMAGVASGLGPSSNVSATTRSSPESRRCTRPNNGLFRSNAPHASAPTDTAAADAIVPITVLSRRDATRAENPSVQTQDHVAHAATSRTTARVGARPRQGVPARSRRRAARPAYRPARRCRHRVRAAPRARARRRCEIRSGPSTRSAFRTPSTRAA